MSQTPAVAHLRRAYGLITGVEDRLGEFRQQVLQHEASAEQDQPFVAGMISAFKGARQLAAEKASLRTDLDLTIREIDKLVCFLRFAGIAFGFACYLFRHEKRKHLDLLGGSNGWRGQTFALRKINGTRATRVESKMRGAGTPRAVSQPSAWLRTVA